VLLQRQTDCPRRRHLFRVKRIRGVGRIRRKQAKVGQPQDESGRLDTRLRVAQGTVSRAKEVSQLRADGTM
jgi:hypothetical protein